ncbi:MAG: hypothetical protein Q8K99_09680 [Actinomycetota bacterium]|nr:hypothetical protein [Actinomycetota bacterium]
MPGGTRYGFTAEEWHRCRDEMRSVLAEIACERQTITYGNLVTRISGRRMSPRSSALSVMLGEVCQMEDMARGTMLGSVVVRVSDGIPGDGYFRHAEELGRDTSDRVSFWRREVEKVWDAWAESER